MTASLREQILSNIATALLPTAGASGRVFRSRQQPFPREETPALIVEPVSDSADTPQAIGYIYWTMTVQVTIYVRGDLPDSIADQLVKDSYRLIMADQTVGGKAMSVVPVTVDWSMKNADLDIGVIRCLYNVYYRNSFFNMEA